ncbi:MAG: hypothetical protein OXG56_02215, partial [Gammaproteobacteria bacterium]|nr:hypothetical protein [Gammaproteobacteria bacterium]
VQRQLLSLGEINDSQRAARSAMSIPANPTGNPIGYKTEKKPKRELLLQNGSASPWKSSPPKIRDVVCDLTEIISWRKLLPNSIHS